MNTTSKTIKRIKPTYNRVEKIPKRFSKFLWDHPNNFASLEKIILRVLIYGRYSDLMYIHKKYPLETYKISKKYSEVNRGVKFWINRWHNG